MEEHDLLIVADGTASMRMYLQSLNTSLPQILSVSALTGCFSRIGILVYRDYSCDKLLEWSGWMNSHQGPETSAGKDQPDLIAMAKGLRTQGNTDTPEAAKTGLAKAYELMRPNAKTLILLYTDAPPHWMDPDRKWSQNTTKEKETLEITDAYGGFGPSFVDWVSAARCLVSGEKQATVFAIVSSDADPKTVACYNYLSAATDGACVHLSHHGQSAHRISKVTVDMILAWMGVAQDSTSTSTEHSTGHLLHYVSTKGMDELCSEWDEAARSFFQNSNRSPMDFSNTRSVELDYENLRLYLPRKPAPVHDFARRWQSDPAYKTMAVEHLMRIVKEDVQAITLNPVFGGLWRAVCADRKYSRRQEILDAFSASLDQLTDAGKKAEMRTWLEESYDRSAELAEIINSVPTEEKYPCVFLDPTLNFGEDGESMTPLTRPQLLEIGRSCSGDVLRRLGRVLTQLTYVELARDMPAHIATTDVNQVPRIPLSLASYKHDRQFWKVIFHLIVPGTKISARPAALVAALCLKLGFTPLAAVAEQEMLSFRDKWSDVSVPENWTLDCLSLLLDADDTYQSQFKQGASGTGEEREIDRPRQLLNTVDRTLFQQLIAFKIVESNLDAPLTARVPWTPEKTKASIGPLVYCQSCQYPRSVTIMGDSGICGHCLAEDYQSEQEKEVRIQGHVSRDVTTSSDATWVECIEPKCRGQYVVYNPECLGVRAKCHYCRFSGRRQSRRPSPVVECHKCLNRMIWPHAYRPDSFAEDAFTCPHCESGLPTTMELGVTARQIATENTLAWLIRDAMNPKHSPFTGRSLFNTISTMGTDGFLSRIALFPPQKRAVTQSAKPIRNSADLLSTLQGFVTSRRTSEVDCSLCFSTFRPDTLHAACGRRGCGQRICTACMTSWYGLNVPGRIINPAALGCPFCRRFPTARTLYKYGVGIHAVQGLGDAVRDQGTWIYAWCGDCGSAKQYLERTCAREAPPARANWSCEECVDRRERQRIRTDRDLAELMAETGMSSEAAERICMIKPCPQCGTMTHCVSGCGHIQCPVGECGSHWCYFCGDSFAEDIIYDHMHDVHGGIYVAETDDEDTDLE
ncbi:uncharacterized protein BDW47DRAFT_60666 [Aspergillus candidus]|uniref:RING-type domain-containing protein n=1 Tax=Aspergillus candidus TaxID=41067 RepID=A0A2I2F4M0_ASPCN|nr:hypothetical protein BDW47DRAFT_60666 [Aspergillus candidus]PLB35585.1 hypothetical protein BDW47DRAFT_60666 [Aspergillus candidus]